MAVDSLVLGYTNDDGLTLADSNALAALRLYISVCERTTVVYMPLHIDRCSVEHWTLVILHSDLSTAFFYDSYPSADFKGPSKSLAAKAIKSLFPIQAC
ncbi:hypothetical protein VM1G_10829 [Cytospora mali]|uniref:Uncharacterized protein n=1 Tax=Cytospora mali TaxID=578113 RepID=A0A194VJ73_CYTMA|nr:hypothetical protein VM1G_10829 [Valsa mali]